MTVPAINLWAVLLATLSSMVVGFVWYSRPVMGDRWMRLTGITEEQISKSPVGAYIGTILASFVTALVLAGAASISQAYYGGSSLLNAVVTALILFAGFTAARFVTHDAFDRRPWALTLLNLGYELITLLVMALIIGLFGVTEGVPS
ncbi:DUF1761 domain-containing protein [Naasia sp. SYSU D00948]|uniref:DUF1761 domain-containing protein n=1 Tax=Naasia sp. SYSU D00948 TaxID=2817379 RepID=UPI001B30395D|nr:DUF1761 domain-containing protein [Naasia sp. SYSU D00948]